MDGCALPRSEAEAKYPQGPSWAIEPARQRLLDCFVELFNSNEDPKCSCGSSQCLERTSLNSNWQRCVDEYSKTTSLKDGFCDKCYPLIARQESWPSELHDSETLQWASAHRHPSRGCSDTVMLFGGAISGSNLCRLIVPKSDTRCPRELLRKLEQRCFSDQGMLEWRMVSLGSRPHLACQLSLIVQNTHIALASVYLQDGRFSYDTHSPIQHAKKWLTNCTEHHACGVEYYSLDLPRRLLSLSMPLRIVDTEDIRDRPRYATLSYCWGSGSETVLTDLSYEQFRQHIPFERLPSTIQDAVRTARALGLMWLWVDALCIIQRQSDQQDWRQEAAKMGDIFGGSFINLAASTSSDVHDGASSLSMASRCSLQAHVNGRHTFISRCDVWAVAVTQSKLARRGWAFQERLLAPRTLYLTSLGMFWECSELAAAEYATDDLYLEPDRDDLCLGRRRAWSWRGLIEKYSRTRLSKQEDRLVAISGLARCQQALTGDRCLAGLWQTELPMQLAWYCPDPQPRTQAWAPTWSWTSVDGEVQYPMGPDECSKLSVVTAGVELVGEDPFGEIQSGVLKLVCNALIESRLHLASSSVVDSSSNQGYSIDLDSSSDPLLRDNDSAYLLLMSQNGISRTYMALQAHEDNHFRRIGVVYVPDDDHSWPTFGQSLPVKGLIAAKKAYSKGDASGRYIITIV